MNKRQTIIELLSKVLENDLTPEAALAAWPAEEKTDDKLMQNAWHSLYHYSIDDDIRAKDQSYEEHQRAGLEEILGALKRDAA